MAARFRNFAESKIEENVPQGEMIEAVEVHGDAVGRARVRCPAGWASVVSPLTGELILEEVSCKALFSLVLPRESHLRQCLSLPSVCLSACLSVCLSLQNFVPAALDGQGAPLKVQIGERALAQVDATVRTASGKTTVLGMAVVTNLRLLWWASPLAGKGPKVKRRMSFSSKSHDIPEPEKDATCREAMALPLRRIGRIWPHEKKVRTVSPGLSTWVGHSGLQCIIPSCGPRFAASWTSHT
eukprot:SAG22_NODE_2868_length_2140_cov_1.193043_3_plen_241_part_00